MRIILILIIFALKFNYSFAADCPALIERELAFGIVSGKIRIASDTQEADVLIIKTEDEALCRLSRSSDGKLAWAPTESSNAVNVITMPTALRSAKSDLAMELTGEWQSGEDAVLTIATSAPTVMSVEGETSYTNIAGSISVGEFSGKIDLEVVDALPLRIPFSVSDQVTDDSCFLDLASFGSFLVVLDSGKIFGNCGGYGATFSGLYTKANNSNSR